jgi:hypothetical protein
MIASDVTAFLERMKDIDQSKRRTEVFRDFCELSFCALAKTTALPPEKAERLEAQYMACVGRYRNPDDVRIMPDLLGMAVNAVASGGRDFLGEIAAEIGVLDAGMGQFFTPYEISRLAAEMTLSGAAEIIREHGFLTLSEPAAGAGGMVIAAADVIEAQGFDPAQVLWVEAVELNGLSFHMLYIQMALRGIAGLAVHGNSLSLETFTEALTPAVLPFLARHGDPFARSKAEAMARQAEAEATAATRAARQELSARLLAETPPTTGGTQLSFFD